MKPLIITILLSLFVFPTLAQPLQVGGEYGTNWLTNFGNKNVVQDSGNGLWSWGAVPKGQALVNNSLVPIGSSTWIFPAFLEDPSPLILNATAPSSSASLFSTDFNSPYFMIDPWTAAQISGQPVVFRRLPY